MSSDGTNNYDIYSSENTSPLEDPDPIPPFELESTKADTLEEYDADEGDGGEDGGGNSNSKIFMIALGVLAVIFIISIIVMILLSTVIMPAQSARRTEEAKLILYGNEQTVVAATQTGEAYAVAAELTRIAVEASPTPIPSSTPTETVMAPTEVPTETPQPAAATETPEPVVETPEGPDPTQSQQETLAALETQVAATLTPTEEGDETQPTLNPAQLTATASASGGTGGAGPGDEGGDELPDTGLLDDGGIYAMAIAALVLVGVIVGARKLRRAN
jgi:cytoskeletal protein RodZ